MTIEIWHNPRCSKSRQGLELLREHGKQPQILKYLVTPPSAERLAEVLELLGLEPRELMRRKSDLYSELKLDNADLTSQQLIQAMADNPSLIERPVVISGNRAVIGRPTETILTVIDD